MNMWASRIFSGSSVEVAAATAFARCSWKAASRAGVDVSGILRREMTLDEAGDALIDMIVRTANGRNTAAEALGHREFVLTRLYESA